MENNKTAGPQDASLGIAFGGGGMKGWAHVGVLSVLQRYGLHPDVISGCSAGALIGAYFAYGYSLEEMKQFMREQRTSSLFSLRFDGIGLLSNDALRDYLRRHLHDCTFEDLQVPFYVTCTDLETGREVVLNKGPLVDAILASSAMPGIFAPVEIEGRLLVDGGLCNNVPVSVLINHGARYTIAIRLHREATLLDAYPVRRKRPVEVEKRISLAMWTDRLKRTFRGEGSAMPNGFEVISRAMDIVVARLESFRLQSSPPDVLITPDVPPYITLSFSEEKEEIFNCGVTAADEKQNLLAEIAKRTVAAPEA